MATFNDALIKSEVVVPPGYHCIICKDTVPSGSLQEHELDPCSLVLVSNADRDWRDQKEQTFFCHFECFRRLLGDDGSLYIKDADFATNGEAEDARLTDETEEHSKGDKSV